MKSLLKKLASAALAIALCLCLWPAAAASPEPAPARAALEAAAEGTDAVSALLAETVDEALDAETAADGEPYRISALTPGEGGALVEYRAPAAVRLVVALYAEHTGRMLACGTADAAAGEDGAAAFVPLADMPEDYIAKAYMLDPASGEPLCPCFTNSLCTRAMRELEASRAGDYDPELVLNLDEDETTNFVVFRAGTKVVPYRAGENLTEDLGDGTYRITNPDSEVLSLQPGDILALEGEDGMLLLCRVKSAETQGEALLLREDEEAELEDIFSAVKLDGGYRPGEAPEETAALMGDEEELEEGKRFSATLYVELEKDLAGGSGLGQEDGPSVTFRGRGTAVFTVYLKVRLTEEEKYVEATVSLDASLHLSVTGETGRRTLDLCEIPILLTPLPVIRVVILPQLIFEAAAGVGFDFDLTMAVGGAYVQDDWESRCAAPKVTDCSVDIEGTVYIGFALGPDIVLLTRRLGNVGITAEAGITLELKLKDTLESDRHACEKCLEGDLTVGIRVYISAEFLGLLKGEADLLNLTLAGLQFYYSFAYQDHGFTRCPHQKYQVTMRVFDPDKAPLPGAQVALTGSSTVGRSFEETFTTGGSGSAETWLPVGDYTFHTQDAASDSAAAKTVRVDSRKTVDLFLTKNLYTVRLKAVDEEGRPVLGATVRGEGLSSIPVTAAGGVAVFTVLPGEYRLTVSKEGYEPAETAFYLSSGEMELTVVLREPAYRVTVTVLDEDGTPLRDARVHIPELDKTVFSDSGGSCFFAGKRGSYTLQGESADGALTGSGAVTLTAGDETATLVLTDRRPTVTVKLENTAGECVPFTPIRGTGLEPDPVTDGEGKAVMRLEKGTYTLTAETDDLYGSLKVDVTGNGQFTIILQTPVVEWEYDEETGALRVWGTGRMQGQTYTAYPWYGLTLRSVTVEGLTAVGVGAFSYQRSLQSVTLPDSLRELGASAFAKCTALTQVNLGNGLERIGSGAFQGCAALETIALPGSITELGDWTFSECFKLADVTLSESLTALGEGCFSGCKALASLHIPAGVTVIGGQAFSGCVSLRELELPAGTVSIGARALYGCSSLESLFLPAAVTEIGELAFGNCYSLGGITVAEENETFRGAEGVLFDREMTCLICCPKGKEGEYAVPEGVTAIGDSAAYGCTKLTAVSIPRSVTTVGRSAFASCTKLTEVRYAGTRAEWEEVTLGMDAFTSQAVIRCSDDT